LHMILSLKRAQCQNVKYFQSAIFAIKGLVNQKGYYQIITASNALSYY